MKRSIHVQNILAVAVLLLLAAKPIHASPNWVDSTNRLLLRAINAFDDLGFSNRFLTEEARAQKLVDAASRGNRAKIDTLLKQGIGINSRTKYGLTALHASEMAGYPAIVKYLESKGAKRDDSFSAEEYVDRMLSDRTSADGPGLCVLIAKNGEVLFRKGYGLASIEHGVPVTPDTKFRIGSVTKQFAASTILKLQEDGKLSVDDPLSKFLPDFPRGDEVKIHHLLTHTSGIRSFTSNTDFFATVAASAKSDEMIDSFKDEEYDFSPGDKWQYNNSGYFLLGRIIEEVSGKSFDDYLRETFFQPLKMNDTGVHTSTAILKHEATGYSHVGNKNSKALDWDMSRAGAAGNLYSTVDDLQRWNEGVFGGKVLSDASLKAALTPVKLNGDEQPAMTYGYGWMIGEHRGLKRIAHSGGLHGFLTNLASYPDQGVTIAVVHNSSPTVPKLVPTVVSDLLATAFLWPEMEPQPELSVDKTVDPQTYDAYTGRYQYGTGAVMTVTRVEKRLFAQLTGQPKFEIFPAGESVFFWKVVDAKVEFIHGQKGEVIAARHSQSGQTFDAPRVKDPEVVIVGREALDAFVGKYRYKGLGVLTVRRQDDRLMAQMTGQPEFEIYPKSETEFFWKVVPAEIRFIRNDEGKVAKAIHKQGGGKTEAEKIE